MTTTKLNNKATSGILDRKYEILEVILSGTSGRLLGANKTLDKNRVLLGPQQENVKNWCKNCLACSVNKGTPKRKR